MKSMLLTGIPGSDKNGLVGRAREILESNGGMLELLSQGDITADKIKALWNAPPSGRPFIHPSVQELVREIAVLESVSRLERTINDYAVIETPMTFFLGGTVFNQIYSYEQLTRLDHAVGGLDYVVTVIDDVKSISQRLIDTPYPKGEHELLDWISIEVDVTNKSTPTYNQKGHVRKMVIPRQHSDETIYRLLTEDIPVAAYIGMPITYAMKNKKAMDAIYGFIERIKEYVIPIVPMIEEDYKPGDTGAADMIKYRDLHWFIKGSDMMIAYFPGNIKSTGVPAEMGHILGTGKPTVLIHPAYKDGKEVFGVRPTLGYRSEDEFFDAVHTSHHKKYDHSPERILRALTQNGKPRYMLAS